MCRGLVGIVVSVLSNKTDSSADSPQLMTYHLSLFSVSRRPEFLILLFKCLSALQCEEQFLTTLIQALQAQPNRYPILAKLVPVCNGLNKSLKEGEGGSESLQQLLSYCISSLEQSSSRIIPSPENWSEEVSFSCSCSDCQDLMRFLRHPTETQHRFKRSKNRRYHLHRQLDSKGCSVTHITERTGSPYTLVVTKTRAAYDKDCQKIKEEKATLSRLLSMKAAVSHFEADIAEASSSDQPSAKRPRVEQ